MDLNHTPLSRYKENSSRQASMPQKGSLSEASDIKSSAAIDNQPGIRLDTLKEGQIIKGLVIDLRYQELKLRLEPSGQILSAHLSDDLPLSIGQSAQFFVADASLEQLTLRYIPQEQSFENMAIQKALTASSLPQTTRNIALVTELLKYKLPIDKQTLQQLTRLAVRLPEASPQTLALMHKNHIPITRANVQQFENYQNNSHSILKDIQNLSKSIANQIFTQSKDSVDKSINSDHSAYPVSPATNQLDQALLSKNNQTVESVQDHLTTTFSSVQQPLSLASAGVLGAFLGSDAQQLSSEGLRQLMDYITAISARETPIASYLSSEDLTLLSKAMEQELLPAQNSSDHTLNGAIAISPEETLRLIQELRGGELSFSETLHLLNKPSSTFTDFTKLSLEARELIQGLQNEDTLQLETLASIKQSLSDIPGLSLTGNETLADLLTASPEYYTFLKEALHKKWTLSPKELSEGDSVKKLYKSLEGDLDKLSKLIKFNKESGNPSYLEKSIQNLQDNLQFMKALNQLFTYVQLPVHFQDRDAHGDLYILNKKRAPDEQKDNLSVLLHLNMTQLGPINIHLILELNQIQATFYTEDRTVSQLIEEHLPSLSQALSQKGFHLQSRVELGESRPDFIRDILEKDSTDDRVVRYSFDVRA